MKTLVEVFLVKIDEQRVRWQRCCLELGPYDGASVGCDGQAVGSCDRIGPPQTPDQAVQQLVRCCCKTDADDPQSYLSHSTSWRFESPNTVVLSYIVCLPERAPVCSQESHTLHMPHATDELPPWQEMRLHDLQLAHGAMPNAPSPPRIEPRHVLSHALRHLTFLVHGPGADPAVISFLTGRAKHFLAQVPSALAGQLLGPGDQSASRHAWPEQGCAASRAKAESV